MTEPLAIATIKDIKQGGLCFTAMFNPASLKVSLSNKLQDEESAASGQKGNGKPQQNTRVSTTKLETELIFDTSDTGADVRADKTRGTEILKKLALAGEGDHPAPPKVEFRWGRFKYIGLIESLNETLDFWSSEGVPLRSTIQLSIAGTGTDIVETGDAATLNQFQQSAIVEAPADGRGTTAVAANAGNSGAGRALAAANGLESMRAGDGGSIAVSGAINFKSAAKFSLSGSAGAGVSAGFGLGASASAGVGASAGLGGSAGIGLGASANGGISLTGGAGVGVGASFGASASASGSAFGAAATAGASASAGAFAGLGQSKTVDVSFPSNPINLLPPSSAEAGVRVDVTGRVIASESSGLSAQLDGQVSVSEFLG